MALEDVHYPAHGIDWLARKLTPFAVAFFLSLVLNASEPASAAVGRYAIVSRIRGPATRSWDYATVDPSARRVYLTSDDGVLILDLAKEKVSRLNVTGKYLHGLVPVGNGLMAIADGEKNQVRVFVAATGATLFSVPTGAPPSKDGWRNPDALLVDPTSGLLIAVNGDSGMLVLIDVKARNVVGTIRVGGRLEFAAAIGRGRIAVNIESLNAVAIVDILNKRLVTRTTLRDCENPTGLAYNDADRLVMSVCGNGTVSFIDPQSAVEVASVRVGKGADAILYDPIRRLAFVTAGDDGTVSVINVRRRQGISLMQTIPTQAGVRLGALDTVSGKLYLPAVKYDTSAPPVVLPGLPPMPAAKPGTFEFLVVGPK